MPSERASERPAHWLRIHFFLGAGKIGVLWFRNRPWIYLLHLLYLSSRFLGISCCVTFCEGRERREVFLMIRYTHPPISHTRVLQNKSQKESEESLMKSQESGKKEEEVSRTIQEKKHTHKKEKAKLKIRRYRTLSFSFSRACAQTERLQTRSNCIITRRYCSSSSSSSQLPGSSSQFPSLYIKSHFRPFPTISATYH